MGLNVVFLGSSTLSGYWEFHKFKQGIGMATSKDQKEAASRLLARVQKPEGLYELLSRCGDVHGRHKLCEFCERSRLKTCPHGAEGKTGPCLEYGARDMPANKWEKQILAYHQVPAQ
jgi:hypothetical protein